LSSNLVFLSCLFLSKRLRLQRIKGGKNAGNMLGSKGADGTDIEPWTWDEVVVVAAVEVAVAVAVAAAAAAAAAVVPVALEILEARLVDEAVLVMDGRNQLAAWAPGIDVLEKDGSIGGSSSSMAGGADGGMGPPDGGIGRPVIGPPAAGGIGPPGVTNWFDTSGEISTGGGGAGRRPKRLKLRAAPLVGVAERSAPANVVSLGKLFVETPPPDNVACLDRLFVPLIGLPPCRS